MIGIFGISMLVTGILFLKNNVFGAAGGNREVIATVNGTKFTVMILKEKVLE